MDQDSRSSPWWVRWGLCLLASTGALPFIYSLASLVDNTPAFWVFPGCMLVSVGLAAAFIKPWRADL